MSDATDTELFAEIPGRPGYRVSTHGRIQSRLMIGGGRSGMGDTWRDLKLSVSASGHLYFNCRAGSRKGTMQVHRVVLEAFVGPCPAGMECCHNDGNPANNRLDNLRWDTRRANIMDRLRHGTLVVGVRTINAKLTDEIVREIRQQWKSGSKQAAIARRFGLCSSHVSLIVNRKMWRHVV